jgi:hypothetical protein
MNIYKDCGKNMSHYNMEFDYCFDCCLGVFKVDKEDVKRGDWGYWCVLFEAGPKWVAR